MKYFSEDLNKNFDTIEQLEAAEKAFKEENRKKLVAKENRKADAKTVEDAYKALNEAKLEKTKALEKAYAEYKDKYSEIREAYLAQVDTQNQLVKQADEKYIEALKEFNKKHPEGYHLTLRDGDSVADISVNTYSNVRTELKEFENFFSDFFKEFLNII